MNEWSRDVEGLAWKLVLGYRRYFSNGVLNSDGRRVFESLARRILREKPWYKPVVARARRDPSLENVLRVLELVVDRDKALEALEAVVNGPYKWRL